MVKTNKEKRFWVYALLVWLAILATLAMGRPLQHMLRDQNIQAVFFLTGMILVGATIFLYGFQFQTNRTERAIGFGLVAVYLMFIFRLGAPERSHLIEYSVLAIFIHKALMERWGIKKNLWQIGLTAFIMTSLLGIMDEAIQYWLPNRSYDPEDMVFNTLAAFLAVGGSMLLYWARRKFS